MELYLDQPIDEIALDIEEELNYNNEKLLEFITNISVFIDDTEFKKLLEKIKKG